MKWKCCPNFIYDGKGVKYIFSGKTNVSRGFDKGKRKKLDSDEENTENAIAAIYQLCTHSIPDIIRLKSMDLAIYYAASRL